MTWRDGSDWGDLMRAANGGDAAAYRRLLMSLAPALRAFVRRNLGRSGLAADDAEDVVQDTLLAIHLKRQTWDPALPLAPWVRAIARNKLIDALRRRGFREHLPIEDFAETLAGDAAEPEPLPSTLGTHLDNLPDRQRAVVRAISLEGASIRETAGRLAMSEGAVRVALHRGLSALAAKFRRPPA